MTSLDPPTVTAGAAAEAAARFVERAAPDVDVAYAIIDSPVGPLVGARTSKGLAALSFESHDGGRVEVDSVLEWIAAKLSPRILEVPARFEDVRRELDEYFDRKRTEFDVPIDWALTTPFAKRVLQATAGIRFGETRTYGEIAAAAGNPKAARATGGALNSNPIPIIVPCHRVVGASGQLVGYGGGIARKVTLLQLEGVAV